MSNTVTAEMTETLEVARRYLEGLSAMDADATVSPFADDAVQDMPFSPPGFPKQVAGREALRQLYGSVVTTFPSVKLEIVGVQHFADPAWVLVEFTGEFEKPAGGYYRNHYFGMFNVVDGKIKTYRELYDPLVFTTSFSAQERAESFAATGSEA